MIRTIRRHLKWWWQRRTRGFDDRELWSLDYTLARWLHPRLVEFGKHKPGTPLACWEEGDGETADGNPIMDRAEARWRTILLEMRAGMEAVFTETDDSDDPDPAEWIKREDARIARAQRGFDLLAKYHGCLWE